MKQKITVVLLVLLLLAMIVLSIFAISGIRRGVSGTKLTANVYINSNTFSG